jgi:hypothetical protein
MITAHLGFKRDSGINPWVKCAELNVMPTGEAVLSFTAIRQGLLQGRAFDGAFAPYLDGDIYCGSQWVGFMQTAETDTGVWYTAIIEAVPFASPSPAGIVLMRMR